MIPRTHLQAPPHFYPNSNWLEQQQTADLTLTGVRRSAWECPDTCQLSCIMPESHIMPADYRHWSLASRTIDLIHNTCHLCLRSRTDGIKAMSHGFSGGKQGYKICQYKKSQSSLFILDNRKWTTIYRYLKEINDKLWIVVFIVTFLDTVMTVGE